jgi:hypothetical protein
VVEAVRFLDDVLRRMQRHQKTKHAMLRKLAISEICEPARNGAHGSSVAAAALSVT